MSVLGLFGGPHVGVTALSHNWMCISPATKTLVSLWQLRVKLLVLRWPEKAEGQMYRLAKADQKAASSVTSLNATNVIKERTMLHRKQSHNPAASSAGTGCPCSQGLSNCPNQEYKFTSLFLPFPASYRIVSESVISSCTPLLEVG